MKEAIDKIRGIKEKYGKELVILGHHYQREEIIELSDFIGDSYYLAKSSAMQKDARYIVFCGVRFMAEASAMLCSPDQSVLHPDREAGCPLADMADLESVENAWQEIAVVAETSDILPVTYINSSAELKAFCGRNKGLVCTSSNAKGAFDWAFERACKLFFFPDEHLGRNTAISKGIDEGEIILWRPGKEMGGNRPAQIRDAKIILWQGHCHVHTLFTAKDVVEARKRFEGVKVIVHPECPREVVEASDESGSTGFIVDYVKRAPKGSIIAIGTEINLVSRLAKANKDKTIVELKRSLCPNMYRINPRNLLHVLSNLDTYERVVVDEKIKKEALAALNRMLEVSVERFKG